MATADDILDWIASESDAFAAAIRLDTVDAPVPPCPDWSLRELTWHLARVQRVWSEVIRKGEDVPPDFSRERVPGPSDAGDLAAWMRASTSALLDALRTHAWDGPAWVWWKEPRTVGAIGRHQVQEAAVHRWDAQSAIGPADPIPTAIAIDAVDELAGIFRQLRDPAPVVFRVAENGAAYPMSDAPPVVTVDASANDLLLLMYGRVSRNDVRVDGDVSVLDAFLAPIE